MTDKPQYDTKQLTEFLANEIVCGATKSISFDYLELLDKIFSAYEPPYDRHGLIGRFAAHRRLGMTFSPTLNYLLEHKYVRATADNSKLFVLTERGEKAQDKGGIKKFESYENWGATKEKIKTFMLSVFVPVASLGLLYFQTCHSKMEIKNIVPVRIISDSTSGYKQTDKTNGSCNAKSEKDKSNSSIKPIRHPVK